MINKNYKKVGCMFLTFATMFSFTSFADQEKTDTWLIKEKTSSQVEAQLVSAIDGSPFIASFDSETGIVSMYNLDGELEGQRKNYNEEKFAELVEVNKNAVNQNKESGPERNRIAETNETTSTPRTRSFHVKDTLDLPQEDWPEDSDTLVGDDYFETDDSDDYVELWTWDIPSHVDGIDVYFTNAIGDDNEDYLDIEEMDEVRFNIDFPGEDYAAKVSCYYDSLDNIELTFFSDN